MSDHVKPSLYEARIQRTYKVSIRAKYTFLGITISPDSEVVFQLADAPVGQNPREFLEELIDKSIETGVNQKSLRGVVTVYYTNGLIRDEWFYDSMHGYTTERRDEWSYGRREKHERSEKPKIVRNLLKTIINRYRPSF